MAASLYERGPPPDHAVFQIWLQLKFANTSRTIREAQTGRDLYSQFIPAKVRKQLVDSRRAVTKLFPWFVNIYSSQSKLQNPGLCR